MISTSSSSNLTLMDVRKLRLYLLCAGVALLCVVQINACPLGYYGYQCKSECSMTCLSVECNETTGACTDGCKDGYVGLLCDEQCESGFYGNNCSRPCPINCVDDVCLHDTGHCINGCRPGFLGNSCEDPCSQGYFGDGCKSSCPINCEGALCHHETGQCLNGCSKEFWGVDCSLKAEIKENSDTSKQTFYDNLSAESRSVLLFILMGEYEETLERAQREIRKGIQQRNQLRELIGGNL